MEIAIPYSISYKLCIFAINNGVMGLGESRAFIQIRQLQIGTHTINGCKKL